MSGSIKCTSEWQRRSHLFLIGAAEIERRRGECEWRMGEAILGGPGACFLGKFLNKRCDFMYSGMILSSNFVSFWRHFFGIYPLIWQENIVMERRNFCDGIDVLPYSFSWTVCFFFCLFFSLGVWRCGRGAFLIVY